MCGIAGVVSTAPADVDPRLLQRLADALGHRGPDDVGYLRWAPGHEPQTGRKPASEQPAAAGLAFCRLAVLDLSEAGAQPMSHQDGLHLVFNGEIYNYVELRRELASLGHSFRSTGDTEVLLAALRQWGKNCLTRLVGMFALAVLDTRAGTLTLARDPFGIKPLFYATWPGGLAFASEIGALLCCPRVRARAKPAAVHDYLRFGLTDHQEDTLFDGVRNLPPGHVVTVSVDRPDDASPVRWWSVRRTGPVDVSLADAANRLRELFLESVRVHLRSDVPVGIALSGGIDSSSIVAAVRNVQQSDVELHTFSFVTKDPARDEERWIDRAASATGSISHKVVVEPHDLVDDLDGLIRAQGEPFLDTTVYAQARVFRLAADQGVKVMLDGQGADELLAGYRSHLAARVVSLVRAGRVGAALELSRRAGTLPGGESLWRTAARVVATLAPNEIAAGVRRAAERRSLPGWLHEPWFMRNGVRPRLPNRGDRREALVTALLEALCRTSLPALLRYEDRNSMAVSVESRVPFVTPGLAEFVLALPEKYLVAGDATSKAVFREAMRGLVPDEILDRRDKIGFGTPEAAWLVALSPWVKATLTGDAAAAVPAFDLPSLRRGWDAVVGGRRAYDGRLWRAANLVRWSELFSVEWPD